MNNSENKVAKESSAVTFLFFTHETTNEDRARSGEKDSGSSIYTLTLIKWRPFAVRWFGGGSTVR